MRLPLVCKNVANRDVAAEIIDLEIRARNARNSSCWIAWKSPLPIPPLHGYALAVWLWEHSMRRRGGGERRYLEAPAELDAAAVDAIYPKVAYVVTQIGRHRVQTLRQLDHFLWLSNSAAGFMSSTIPGISRVTAWALKNPWRARATRKTLLNLAVTKSSPGFRCWGQ
jgi:hypothetical protein